MSKTVITLFSGALLISYIDLVWFVYTLHIFEYQRIAIVFLVKYKTLNNEKGPHPLMGNRHMRDS
jgi:predicted ABC-type sugar transport system permease subunit